ncbi:MAG: DUF1499 domain-containing protein [Candidatus Binataceae bacterium]
MNLGPLPIGGLLIALAAFVFVPAIRRTVRIILRVAIIVVPLAAAAAGVATIMNNETVFEEPGASRRIVRFLTVNSAATSKSGSGAVACDMSEPPPKQPAASPAETNRRRHSRKTQKTAREAVKAEPSASPTPGDTYPELVMRSYPGLPRRKLFDLARDAVDSLGGWKIAAANPAAGTIDCVYASRIFKLEDDLRITVRPDGEVGVCSRSGAARPDSDSLLRFVPGDLGANIGRIKEFYDALDPLTDAAYREEQERQNARTR